MESPPTPNWLQLPHDVTSTILHKLGAIEILENAQKVCTAWYKLCKQPSMWKVIDMRNSGNLWEMPYDLEKMTMNAVDRSCGNLVDINLEYFCKDKLLHYILDRSSHLRRLRMISCYYVTDRGLEGAAAKLSLLEELEIYKSPFDKEALEALGRHCPLLKTFKYNMEGHRHPNVECDDEALAIAGTMPGLRHLQLFGGKLTNLGLKAILEGCPHLESLDLRQCYNINLAAENLGKICSERIKNLWCPNDSTEGYEFESHIGEDDDYDDADSFCDGYPSGFSDIEMMSDYDDGEAQNEFSGESDGDDFNLINSPS